jgi:hypothetical protein
MGIYTTDNGVMSLENGMMDTPLYVYHNESESFKFKVMMTENVVP